MSQQQHEAQIAAFIRANGVTRCPTACAAPTQAAGSAADRAALRERAERLEEIREEKARQARLQFGWVGMTPPPVLV
jgi:hypothetical protein